MKTFDEAFASVVRMLPAAEATPEREQEMIAQVSADIARTQPLINEAAEHRHLKKILNVAGNTACCPYHAAFAGFQLGLRIGMEMERSETGGVLLDT